jgi:hypothetical protein
MPSSPQGGGYESMEIIHSTIMQDMRAFEERIEFQFVPYHVFDAPRVSEVQDMPDIQCGDGRFFVGEPFNPHPQPLGNFQMGLPVGGFSPGPPVLDATWQSFVEQLGF